MQSGKTKYIIAVFLIITTTLLSKHSLPYREKVARIEQELSILENSIEPVNAHLMIEKAQQALQMSASINYQRGVVKGTYVLALAYHLTGDFKQAVIHYDELINNEEASHYAHYLSLTHKGKGEVFQYVGLDNWAKQAYKKGIDLASQIDKDNYRHIVLSMIYARLGSLYHHPGDTHQMDTFDYYINKTEQEVKKIESGFIYQGTPLYHVMKSDYFIRHNRLDSSKIYIDKLLRYTYTNKSTNYPYVYIAVGNHYDAAHQPDSAEYYYRYALQRSRESGLVTNLPRLYNKMSQLFKKQELPDSAHHYHQLYLDAENQQSGYLIESSREIVNTLLKDSDQQGSSKVRSAILLVLISVIVIILTVGTIIALRYRKGKLITEIKITRLNNQLNHAFEEVVTLARKNDPTFVTRFQEVYPVFWNNLIKAHPDLSPAELHLCAMTYLNFTTQQIADYGFLQVRSVQTRRSRLRKKINLHPKEELYHYLISFDSK